MLPPYLVDNLNAENFEEHMLRTEQESDFEIMDEEDAAGLEGSIRGDDDREVADVSIQQDETGCWASSCWSFKVTSGKAESGQEEQRICREKREEDQSGWSTGYDGGISYDCSIDCSIVWSYDWLIDWLINQFA